ncbi:putative ribonuclease H-like domain-containing protein [Tanacetum coccineum]
MANVTSLLTSLCNNFKNSASTSNSGTLPSQTVTNPRQQINAITTRSGKTLEEPSTPLVPTPDVSKPQKEPEQNPETSTEKVQNPNLENTAHVPPPGEEDSIFIEIPKPKAKKTVNLDPNSPNPNSYQSKLPYPERMKVRENDKPSAQHSRFLKMFKQLRLEIGLKDALVEMPKFNKWLSSLLRNKEKLEEIAITTVNAECSAIIMNKVPEKLEDPGKFLIPCALQELNRTSALADSGASINLLPHSIYKKLELEALTPTRMTLELANRSITHPMGIAEDVVVRVDGFTFLADFVVVNFEPDPRVPIILGRPFLRTAKALIDLYEETLTLRVGKEELVYYADKSEKNKNKHCAHAISVIDFSKDDPSPSSSPVKTSDNFEKFADELAPLDSLPPGNDDSTLKKDLHEENFQENVEIKNSNVSDEPVLLNTPLSDKVECFAPEDNNDEIDDFLAMEVLKLILKKIRFHRELILPSLPPLKFQVAILLPLLSPERRTVGENRASWFDKLDDALWAFRTSYKTPIGCTPYKLVYGKSCHLPVELEHKAYCALKHANFDLKTAGEHRKLQLNELHELHDQAYENSLIYKEKTKRIHDAKFKNCVFNVGDRVLFFNSRLKIFSGKLKSRWSGPFTITEVFPYGTAKLSHPDGSNFKVNCHRLKHYFGGDMPPLKQIAVQRETKARTILLQSLPEDHMADFHHLDDAKDIWLAVKARFGGNEESKKMRKSMLKQEFADFKISESEGLHKGYDRFQKVAITLKTKGGLDFLSFDDLYNKLRTLEIDVKGGSSYDSRVPAAPTHSAFISAASTNSKWSTADSKCQPSSVSYTTTSSSADASGNVLENVLHSFVAESDPQQQITYEDFDQIGKLDLEELDIKWQMAMLSVRINRFEKKAGRKFKFNNKDAARFDKKKVRCYQCSELGHFARECTGKKVDSKTRYSAFKLKELDKSEEPKALVSVDSMLNWSDHESEDMEKGTSEVYGMIAGYGDDAVIPAVDAADGVSTDGIFADGVFVATGNGSDGVSVAAGVGADGVSVTSSDATDAETQFALMGLSPQVQSCPFGCNYIYTELKKDFDNLEVQYKECFIQVQAYKSSLQNLEQQKSWYQNNQLALEEKIRILTADLGNTTNMLKYTEKLNEQAKIDNMNNKVKLEESEARSIKQNIHASLNKPDIEDTQYTYGSKSNNCVETNSVSNDFVSCDNSDKSSDSETTDFASCVSSVQTSSSKTNEPLASASSSVDLQTSHKTDDQGPCNVTHSPSFSFKENVKTPKNLCNRNGSNNISLCKNKSFGSKKCFVCGSKFHLIRDCDFYENQLRLNNAPVWKNVENIPSFVPRPAYVPASSRNRPTSVPAGRPIPAGWHNPAARPMTRPKSHYFQQFSRPGSYNQMDMDGGRWGTAVKTSAGCSWQSNRPYMHWGSKNNGGSQQSTGFSSY